MKVAVYMNLHKKMISIKALEGSLKGRVIAYSHDISITNVTFKVSEAGRQRVLRDKAKNVHAYAIGYLSDTSFTDLKIGVSYDPYKMKSFTSKEDQSPIYHANRARVMSTGLFI